MPWLLVQTLALMQWRAGRLQEARELFQEAVTNCAPHAPLWAAWANVEVRNNPMTTIFQEAVTDRPPHAHDNVLVQY